jgi:DNA modification methylase
MNKYELHLTDCKDLVIDPVDLIYLDPPYSSKKEDEYYGEGETLDEFLAYMKERLENLQKLMKPSANILVHVDYKAVHYLKVMMDGMFGRDSFKNEIIWCFSNPASAKKWLPRKHNTILWYGVGDYIFNQPRIPYKTKMNVGGAAAWSKEKIPWEKYEQKGKLLEDWWTDIPALCRNEPEKTGYATQKPRKLMQRVVEIWSNAESRILDPFCGSGSLIETGVSLGRYSIGSDKSKQAIDIAQERVSQLTTIFDSKESK